MTEVRQDNPEKQKMCIAEDHQFETPKKCIKSAQDISIWEKSEAYQEYLGFIFAIGDAIRGKKIRDVSLEELDTQCLVVGLISIFEELDKWIDEIPPVEQQQRFGNKAFRDWYKKLSERSSDLITNALSKTIEDSSIIGSIVGEIHIYLLESFGNPTRIDYGTGHEMAFVMFLSSLFLVGALDPEKDRAIVGLLVFDKYMKLVRKLQNNYRMEPAGSQGVWALDDYQFVAFIWGAAQMVGNTRVKPKSISDYDIADILAPDNHLFSCIKHIATVKTGPFAEHSNQLWNVSGVPLWDKVYTGLVKMYRAEVLSKFPVIQHTFFGSLFTLKPAINTNATKRLEMKPASTISTPNLNALHDTQIPPRFPMSSRQPNQSMQSSIDVQNSSST